MELCKNDLSKKVMVVVGRYDLVNLAMLIKPNRIIYNQMVHATIPNLSITRYNI